MKPAVLALIALLGQGTPEGVQIERTVKRTTIDWLGRRGEIHRKEILLIKGSTVSITDVTFGERLIIRADRKKVWKADPLAREFSELTFDEVAAARKVAIDELRAVRARVPGTKDEGELNDILEGLDQFDSAPKAELKTNGAQRDILVNGNRVRMSVQINPEVQAPGWLDSLAAIGSFHPAIAEKFKELGGVPMKGTIRYVLFLDRVIEQFEVTSVKAREIADSEFDLPPGLKEVPLAGFERAPEKKPAKPAQFKLDDPAPPKDKP